MSTSGAEKHPKESPRDVVLASRLRMDRKASIAASECTAVEAELVAANARLEAMRALSLYGAGADPPEYSARSTANSMNYAKILKLPSGKQSLQH
ncbi:hypothetical protein EVAR_44792_1 [Eumeta japonica]|uniref:Uncharacterized protein n=1 Tax=Eumeta variegata TaxID=151549 RepID=A0A4C1XBA0_EUMVA|nr:hypothetical protein EVAR_44792_1 [Eumeta japonica]